MGEIAARIGLAQSLVSRTVAKMQSAGVLITSTDPTDRRRKLISIAPEIRPGLLHSRARHSIEPALQSRYPGASRADVARVITLLDELAKC